MEIVTEQPDGGVIKVGDQTFTRREISGVGTRWQDQHGYDYLWGDVELLLARHPEPTVSDGEREGDRDAPFGTYALGRPKPSPIEAILETEDKRHGQVLPGADSHLWRCACGDWDAWGFDEHVRRCQTDALLVAGYRKAPVVSVEDVARVIDPAIYPDINRLTGDGWAASVRAATAVMALLDPKEGK